MGRRPEPIERKAIRAKGDGRLPGGRQIATAAQVIAVREDMPPCPRDLKVRGRLEWRKIWAAGPWIHSAQDYPWVEQICRAYDDITAFRRVVNADGLIQRGSLGQPVAHPLIAEIRKCEQTIRQCLSVLGFSPTDRARLGIAEIKRETALQEMIAKAQR